MFNTQKFIAEVKKRPVIYDPHYRQYNDRHVKTLAWMKVGQAMTPNWGSMSEEEKNAEEKNLRNKWRNIRDYFMKELKAQQSLMSGKARGKVSRYSYFDDLLFLVNPETTSNSAITESVEMKFEESDEADDPLQENSAMSASTSTEASEMQRNGLAGRLRPKLFDPLSDTSLASFDNDIPDMMSSHGSQRAIVEEEDYDKMFLLSLLPSLRQVPENMKLQVRIGMQQVIASALQTNVNP